MVSTSSLQQRPETSTQVEEIEWNIERHTLLIKNRTIALTLTEFQLLYPLRTGLPVTYAELALMVYNCSMDNKVRMMLDKHIDRMRSKLRGTGIYIYCVLGYGYLLFPENWSDACA
ncbi:MAG: response regulator transcription factor [Ktedonobacteraceae bacterium]|nr:response regulator transcription factor [Ktedonobacteraceae bacterium]MBV9710616.1 response regulator transcription factor [Ktedonobacteraceae bacterium]